MALPVLAKQLTLTRPGDKRGGGGRALLVKQLTLEKPILATIWVALPPTGQVSDTRTAPPDAIQGGSAPY